jgi:hypothetical protein
MHFIKEKQLILPISHLYFYVKEIASSDKSDLSALPYVPNAGEA